MPTNPNDPVFAPLPIDEVARLDKQRDWVAAFLAENFPELYLTRTKADFTILQKVVDSKIIGKSETWKLQSLGVVFGDALVSFIDGFAWCEVTDAYGTDPTLRYCETSLQLNAMTMISKRVEEGKDFDVQQMADFVAQFIRDKSSGNQ